MEVTFQNILNMWAIVNVFYNYAKYPTLKDIFNLQVQPILYWFECSIGFRNTDTSLECAGFEVNQRFNDIHIWFFVKFKCITPSCFYAVVSLMTCNAVTFLMSLNAIPHIPRAPFQISKVSPQQHLRGIITNMKIYHVVFLKHTNQNRMQRFFCKISYWFHVNVSQQQSFGLKSSWNDRT